MRRSALMNNASGTATRSAPATAAGTSTVHRNHREKCQPSSTAVIRAKSVALHAVVTIIGCPENDSAQPSVTRTADTPDNRLASRADPPVNTSSSNEGNALSNQAPHTAAHAPASKLRTGKVFSTRIITKRCGSETRKDHPSDGKILIRDISDLPRTLDAVLSDLPKPARLTCGLG